MYRTVVIIRNQRDCIGNYVKLYVTETSCLLERQASDGAGVARGANTRWGCGACMG